MFFLLFIFIHMMPIFAVCQNDLFLKVMKLYDNEKYADARSILEMIEPKNSFVLYNVGNCYYGEDNQVEALYYWYQAFRYGTAKEKLLIAQRICQVHSRMSVPAHDDSKHGSFCSFVFLCPSLLLWQILLLFVWILLLYVLFYMRSSVALCLLISMSACFMCCTVYYAYYLRLPALLLQSKPLCMLVLIVAIISVEWLMQVHAIFHYHKYQGGRELELMEELDGFPMIVINV